MYMKNRALILLLLNDSFQSTLQPKLGYQDRTEVVENQRGIELVSDILHH